LPHAAVKQILTIPGIGKRTAGILAAKIVSIDRFDSPEKLVGYFGFFPEESSSGVDKVGRPLPPGASRMSAKGNDLARAYLWMGAKSAILHNPAVRPLYCRLEAKGKRGDVALGHCARKLLHLVFAIWKTNQPFHPEHYPWAQETESTSQPTPTDAPKSTHAKNATGLKQDDVRAKKEVTVAASNVSSAASRVNGSSQSKPEHPNPSVDYAYLRSQIGFERVLRHLNRWEQLLRRIGPELRGPCPLHSPLGSRSRSFAVNPEKHVYQCFGKSCHESGNVLDFWAAYHNLPFHQAALILSETFQLETTKTEKRSP